MVLTNVDGSNASSIRAQSISPSASSASQPKRQNSSNIPAWPTPGTADAQNCSSKCRWHSRHSTDSLYAVQTKSLPSSRGRSPLGYAPNGCGLRGSKSGDICAQISSGNRQPSSFFSKPMIDLLFMDVDLKITDEPYWDTLLKPLAQDSYSASNLATRSRRCWADAYSAIPPGPGALTSKNADPCRPAFLFPESGHRGSHHHLSGASR